MDWADKFFKTKKYDEMTKEEVSAALEKLQTDIAAIDDEGFEHLTQLQCLLWNELRRRDLPEEYQTMETSELARTEKRLDRDIYRLQDDHAVDNENIDYMLRLQHSMELELEHRSRKKREAEDRLKKMSVEELTRHRQELEDECTTTGKFEIEAIDIELEKREQEALFQQGNYRAMTTFALEQKYGELSDVYEWSLKRVIGDELDRRGGDYASFSNKHLAWVLKQYLLDRDYQSERFQSIIDAEIEKVRAVMDERGDDARDEPDFCYYRENPRLKCECSRCKCSCGCC